jgi:hypothetical protein
MMTSRNVNRLETGFTLNDKWLWRYVGQWGINHEMCGAAKIASRQCNSTMLNQYLLLPLDHIILNVLSSII